MSVIGNRCLLVLLLITALLAGLAGCGRLSDAETHLSRAASLLASHKTSEAQSEVNAAIASDPARTATYLYAMSLYERNDQRIRAAKIGEALLRRAEGRGLNRKLANLEKVQLLISIGGAYWDVRDLQSAERAFRKAVKLSPQDPNALNSLGYFYAQESMRLPEALRLTRRAADLAPDSGMIVDSLGWAQYRLGRYPDAVMTLKKAVKLSPEEPDLRYHLGAAYARNRQRVEAQIELKKVLEIDSRHTQAAALLRSIRKEH